MGADVMNASRCPERGNWSTIGAVEPIGEVPSQRSVAAARPVTSALGGKESV